MENSILPITSPAEPAGPPPSRGTVQPDGNFAAVLADASRVNEGTGEPGGEAAAETPATSEMLYLLAGFLGFTSPEAPVKEDKDIFLTDSDATSAGTPPPGSPSVDEPGPRPMPAGPAGFPLPSQFEFSDMEEKPYFDAGGRIIPSNRDGGANPIPFSVSAAPVGDETITVPRPAAENLLSLRESKMAEGQPNIPPNQAISPEGLGATQDVDPDLNQGSPTDPAVQSRKSIVPPVPDGKGAAENRRMAEFSQEPPPAAVEPSRNPVSTPHEFHTPKGVGDSAPRAEIRDPLPNQGPSGTGGNSPYEGPDPAPVTAPRASHSSMAQGGEKGQENNQWTGGETAPQAKKETQSRVDPYGTSSGVREARTGVIGKGEAKETGSPVPTKTETPGASQQVGQRLIWSIRNNEETVRMSLEPPELGRIVLEINRSKENIKTILWTDNPQTRAVLESGHLEIQRIVENEGFKLEKFNVLVQQDMGGFHGRREDSLNPHPWKGASSPEVQGPGFQPADPLPSIPGSPRSASTYLNLLV